MKKILASVMGKDEAKAAYAARFKARGKVKKGRTNWSDRLAVLGKFPAGLDHAYRSKPEHAKRFADLEECFPPIAMGHTHE